MFNEINHLKDPLQSIAQPLVADNAMFAPGITSSRGTATLAEVPRVTTVEISKRDKGVYIPPGFTKWIYKMGGDMTKSAVLSQVLYWYKKGESGKPKITRRAKGNPALWLIKEYEELAAECGITEKMVRDAIKWACSAGILIKETHGFAGKRATYMRFACAQGGDHVVDQQQIMNFPYLPYRPTGLLHKDPQVFSNTQSTFSESTLNSTTYILPAESDPAGKGINPQPLTAGSGETKPNQTTPVVFEKSKPNQTNPAPSPGSAGPSSPEPERKPGRLFALDLYMHYASQHSLSYGEHPLVIGKREAGMMKDVLKNMGSSSIYLTDVIRNLFSPDVGWGRFVWDASRHNGVDVRFSPCSVEGFKTFIKYWGSATQLMPKPWIEAHRPVWKARLEAEEAQYWAEVAAQEAAHDQPAATPPASPVEIPNEAFAEEFI
jgi:hypothetical protein